MADTSLGASLTEDETTLEDHPTDAPAALRLELVVRDRDVIQDLCLQGKGRTREDYAQSALKIGVLALRHANSQIDAELVRNASAELLGNLQKALEENAARTQERTATVLKEYFDPSSGRLPERLERLVSQDGELARFFQGQLHGEGSPLAKRLDSVIAPLLKQLDPQQSEGLLATLRKVVDTELSKQQQQVLKEFSLDNPEGALSNLVRQLTAKHGDLSKDLQGKIDEVIKEFDLNEDDSALNRLVGNVERAQRTITSEFSLDNEQSALMKLKRELVTLLEAHVRTNAEFQEEVKVTLAKLTQKRASDAASTQHGHQFEEAVFTFIQNEAQQRGDLPEPTGATTGQIKNCKKGDAVVTLGPDSAAEGARIVFEAKDERGYSPSRAKDEIAEARKNRQADIGVFVFARQNSPEGLRPLTRFRNDLIVVWDAEDPSTDPFLFAAMEIARACSIEFRRGKEATEVDLPGIEKGINEIERRVANYEKIRKPAETIRSSSETILDRIRIDQEALEKQIALLRKKLEALQGDVAGS